MKSFLELVSAAAAGLPTAVGALVNSFGRL